MPLRWIVLLLAPALAAGIAVAQIMEGELRLAIRDPSGRPVEAKVELLGRDPQFHAEAEADRAGEAVLRRLPTGVYQLRVRYAGFVELRRDVEIRSAVPRSLDVVLSLGVVETVVTVEEALPLIDPSQPIVVVRAGREQLEENFGTTLGRSTVDVVTTMPGWLLEANAVLHPRGSEYDTQYVIDGMPLYDNRSIAFAPAFENSELEAVNVITAGIPAEYGRRLGGVIALDTRRVSGPGRRSAADLQAGSFDTYLGSFNHQYASDQTVVSLGIQGGHTNRYLDPPSIDNFTNKASSAGINASLSQDLKDRDRLTFYFRSNRTGFLVPNDLIQEEAGQRQDRRSAETSGQVHYQHVFSARSLGSVRGMVRDLTSELWSNTLSTPVYAEQDRGFREGAAIADLTIEGERHTLKLGGDVRLSSVRESFLLAAPGDPPASGIDFRDQRRGSEVGLFVQDQIRVGGFAANVGVRFDRYKLLIEDHAVSPRIALSYYLGGADLLLHGSYDRVFQPPPVENLLFSSAAPTLDLDEIEDALPIPASRAHFFEVGLRKSLGNLLRIDVSHYWRRFRNSIDDDVFLNTGLSFPITFDTARIEGTEVRLEMPSRRGVSAFVSYSNMLGRASSPVTGGLFIDGGEAAELRDEVRSFAISQDQRNTVAAQIRVEPHRRLALTAGVRYGSGLPVELEDDEEEEEEIDGEGEDEPQPIPPPILDQIDFERGRVRPNFSLDLGASVRVWERDQRSLALQLSVRNVTDRLNVINFSGLFSGTALAPGRQATIQMRLRF